MNIEKLSQIAKAEANRLTQEHVEAGVQEYLAWEKRGEPWVEDLVIAIDRKIRELAPS